MKKKLFQKKRQVQNYYELLEVQPTATQDDILKSYIRLSLKYKSNQPNASREQFVKIGRAYEVLSDSMTRSAYDRYLLTGGTGDRSAFESPNQSTCKDNEYENYQRSFDAHTRNGARSGHRNEISKKGLHITKHVAGVTGGVVGAVWSKVGQKVAGKTGGFTSAVLQTTGSLIGSAVVSDASSKIVQNMHDQRQSNSKGNKGGMKNVFKKTAHDVNQSSPRAAQSALYNGYMSNVQSMTNTQNHRAARYFMGCS